MKLYSKKDDGTFEEVEVFRTFKSQEEFDDSVKDRIKREQEKFSDYDSIKSKLEDANKSVTNLTGEKKTLEEQLQEKSKAVESEKLNTTRVEVRHEFGLSKDLDKFLVGDTEDDIRSNAEILKKNGGTGGVNIDKDNNPDGAKESPSKTLANGLFNSKKGD